MRCVADTRSPFAAVRRGFGRLRGDARARRSGHAPAILLQWPIVGGLLIFGPLIVALRGRKPALYLAASMFFAIVLGNHVTAWLPDCWRWPDHHLRHQHGAPALRRTTGMAAAVAAIVAASIASWAPRRRCWGSPASCRSARPSLPGSHPRAPRTIVACALAVGIAAGVAEYYWLFRDLALHVKVYPRVSRQIPLPGLRRRRVWYAETTGLYAAFG